MSHLGSQGPRARRLSWFSHPPAVGMTGPGILTLLGSGFPTDKRRIGTALTSSSGTQERVGLLTCVHLPTLRIGDSAILLHG